ncbi:dnaJsubfamily B member 3-like [Dorcoceras hygrometricum]|uniref:DnaJsubfamily B member 3-like n=1 Tax=Dorcoceras hygrometricum TaxID=472368 RepID=A0A2Z7A8S1_9LAMI|nr:dnaJsubfamily B member 3-like [Dorcoceras hygrometricum]
MEGSELGYYSLLGIRKDASSDIRAAYRKLALVNLAPPSCCCNVACDFLLIVTISRLCELKKWDPDRWATNPPAAAEAKSHVIF